MSRFRTRAARLVAAGATATTALLAATVLAAPAGATTTESRAAVSVRTFVALDRTAGEAPEGLTVTADGTVWVAFAYTGEVVAIDPATGERRTVARIDPGQGLVLGVAPAAGGGVLVAAATFAEGTHGLWRVSPDGAAELVAGMPLSTFPNGVASDGADAWVSDPFGGTVWQVDTTTGDAGVWSDDALLAPRPDGIGFGANGMAVEPDGDLLVLNTDRSSLVHVDRRADGSAGSAAVVAQDTAALGMADGVALDARGHAWVTSSYLTDHLSVVTPDGGVRVVATAADGLDYPAGAAFGRSGYDARTLYVGSVGDSAGTAAVQAVTVPVPGAR